MGVAVGVALSQWVEFGFAASIVLPKVGVGAQDAAARCARPALGAAAMALALLLPGAQSKPGEVIAQSNFRDMANEWRVYGNPQSVVGMEPTPGLPWR